MSHVIVLGGAGSGKSVLLAERASKLIEAGRARELLVLVPSRQATRLFAELVLQRTGRKAVVGTKIITLGSLAREVRASAGASSNVIPAAERKDLIVALMLSAARTGGLAALGDSVRLPGFASSFERLVSELRSARVSSAQFKKAMIQSSKEAASPAERQMFEDKAADLCKLYIDYEEALSSSGLIDEEGELIEAGNLLASGRAGLTGGSGTVLIDGFAQFTPAQERLVSAVLARAGESMVALCFDGRADGRLRHVHGAWRAVKAARNDWQELRLEKSWRFAAPDLAAVEQHLFNGTSTNAKPRSIELRTASSLQAECEAAARYVARLVRDEGLRPDEVVIFARRLAPYAPHLERAFRLVRLPLDFVESNPTRELAAATELGTSLRAALPGTSEEFVRWLRAAADLDGAESFIEALRGPLSVDAERRGAAELDALAAERGLSSVEELEGSRSKLGPEGRETLDSGLRKIDALERLLPQGDAEPREWAAGADKCLAELALNKRLLATDWPMNVLRRELAALDALTSALRGAAGAAERAGLGKIGISDYLRLVESAIAGRSLPAPAQRAGAVLAANIFESRTRERRAVLVLGLSEGSFPRDARENPLLGDRERRTLAKTAGVVLPLAADAAEQERYLFYIACTRAKERLYLSSAAPGTADREAARSFFVDELAAVFPKGELTACEDVRGFPAVSELAWKGEALGALAAAMHFPQPEDESSRARWRAVLALHDRALIDCLFTPDDLAQIAPRRSPIGVLSDTRAKERLGKYFAMQTASGLSAFGNCPFAHFLTRGLGIAARRRLEFDAELAGNLLHGALRRAYRKACDGGPMPSPDDAAQLLRVEFHESAPWLANQPQTEPFLAAQVPLLRRMLTEDASRFSACQTRPAHLELSFGSIRHDATDDAAICQKPLSLGDGITLRGRIDRVDLLSDGKSALVIDYKRTMKSWKDNAQALLYALALREVFGLEPVAAGLLALRGGERGRVGGMLHPDFRAQLAGYGFKGDLTDDLLEEARRAAEALARQAASGDIRVWPKDCSSCPDKDAYNPICRFESAEWRAEHNWTTPGEADAAQG